MTEIGVVMEPVPKCSAEMAVRIENMGFDSILCPDTQNLSADPYGQLTLMAHHTKKIQLGTGVTCLLYTSPSPRDKRQSRMPSSA